MSGLLELDSQVKKGDEWRDYLEVEELDEPLCYRQLYDDERAEVMTTVGKEKFLSLVEDIQSARENVDEDQLERLQDLANKDDRSEAEDEELESLNEELPDDVNRSFLGLIDPDVVAGMHKVVEYAIVPDDEDIDAILKLSFDQQESRWGATAKTREQAFDLAKDSILTNITRHSTGFVATKIGFKAFLASQSGN